MTEKEFILCCLIDDDEALTQIVQYFDLDEEMNTSRSKIERLLSEMLEEGYIRINYEWQNEDNEYPYSLTDKGKTAWESLNLE